MYCTANARVSLEEFLPISRGLAGSSVGEELARNWTGWLSCSRASDRFTAKGSGNHPLEVRALEPTAAPRAKSVVSLALKAARADDGAATNGYYRDRVPHVVGLGGGTSWVMSLEARARPAGTSCGPEE